MASPREDLGWAHRFVPATIESPTVTLVLLHGGGGADLDAAAQLGQSILPRAAMLLVAGNAIDDAGRPIFVRTRDGVHLDVDDLIARAEALANFLKAATEAYALNPAGLVATAYADGADLTAATLLVRSGTLAGAVLLRPRLPFFPKDHPRLNGTPVLIACGQSDAVVAPGAQAELALLLERCGARVTTHWRHAGHEIVPEDIVDAHRWMIEFVSRVAPSGT